MKSSPSQHITTISEVNATILDWVQETEEFHRYHRRISAILDNRNCGRQSGSSKVSSIDKSSRMRSLNKLRNHMNHVLEILMADMNNLSGGTQYADNCDTLSRAGRLVTHARLLREINQKISEELMLFGEFQA